MTDAPRLPESVQTIPEMLAFWAERTPGAPALIAARAAVVTYDALWAGVLGFANTLNQFGIQRDDCVVLLLPEEHRLAMALLGTMAAAVALPLPVSLTPGELDDALDGMRVAAVIVAPGLGTSMRDGLARHGIAVFELRGDGSAAPILSDSSIAPRRRGGAARPEDIAFAVQTSGTTGGPKRVPTEHGRVVQDGRTHRDRFGLLPTDRALAVAPLSLSLGVCVLTHAIAAGSSLIFPGAADIAALWRSIVSERPTWMFPAAGLLEILARHLREAPAEPPPPSLRFVRVTGAPISPVVCEELTIRLGAPVLLSYSSSETGLVATALPPPERQKPGASGLPIQQLRIVDDAARDVAPGDIGEIWVRGPKVFAGYLDDPQATAAAFAPGGWFRTGDIGYLDEDGFLFLTGRRNELINRGGAKIAPLDVDEALLAHPAVHAAAAFAVPDGRLGEDIVAAVVLKRDRTATPRELRHWLLARLAPHKAPRRIWFVAADDLPRTPSGKVRRGELAERYLQPGR